MIEASQYMPVTDGSDNHIDTFSLCWYARCPAQMRTLF
jgi:hypothetical protein